jgi:predicted acetyltransferase
MDIKLVPQEDYLQIHRLRDYSFPNKYEGARRADFHYWVEHSTTLGAYDKEKIVGQILVLPLNMIVHGVQYKMGGLGFVATYPEYRNQGIMKRLMTRALGEMRQNGQWISVLAPYSVSFYRHFGWELFFDKLHYTIPLAAFPNFGRQLDNVKRFSFEWMNEEAFQDIQQFHNHHAAYQNGGMIRNDAWWQRIERREPESHLLAYYNDENKIAGYLRYCIQDLTFQVKDFYAEDIKAEQAIWRFITSHKASVKQIKGTASMDSHFGFQFEQPQFKREITQDVMVRIVDAFEFMKCYPWGEIQQPLFIRLQDSICLWNEQLFQISSGGHVSIIDEKVIEDQYVLELSINLFSALMVGYLSVKDALLGCPKKIAETIVMDWQKALPDSRPVFYEYF